MDTKVQDVLGGFEVGSANVKSLEEKVAAMESEVRSTEQQVKNMNSKIYTEQYTVDTYLLDLTHYEIEIKTKTKTKTKTKRPPKDLDLHLLLASREDLDNIYIWVGKLFTLELSNSTSTRKAYSLVDWSLPQSSRT